MPKKAKALEAIEVKRLRHGVVEEGSEGRRKVGELYTVTHAVGGVAGLHLQCSPPTASYPDGIGARSWILRTVVGAKRREFGLGGYPEVSLKDARRLAEELKDKIRQGIDPVEERKAIRSELSAKQAKAVTFKMLAGEFVAKKAKEFKTAKQVQKLENQLKYYALPVIGNLVVADIERAHILQMLQPIWETKTETAARLRMYVERILDLGGVKGLRSGDNPARWKGNLELSLPARNKIAKTKNYEALPIADLQSFFSKLQEKSGMGARALEFAILTAARSGEVREARWDEIDLKARVWAISAERMKAGKQHRVPLSEQAILLLQSMPKESPFIFYNRKLQPVTDSLISNIPKKIGYQVTAHGFRSTFKDWCIEHTEFPDEISELALAHVNSDKTRGAYARTDAFEKRRQLMDEWANYCWSLMKVKTDD